MYSGKFGLFDRPEANAAGFVGKNGDGVDAGTLHTGWIFAPVDSGAKSGVIAVAQINSNLEGEKDTSIAAKLTKAYLES